MLLYEPMVGVESCLPRFFEHHCQSIVFLRQQGANDFAWKLGGREYLKSLFIQVLGKTLPYKYRLHAKAVNKMALHGVQRDARTLVVRRTLEGIASLTCTRAQICKCLYVIMLSCVLTNHNIM